MEESANAIGVPAQLVPTDARCRVSDLLDLPSLAEATLLAGRAGLRNAVTGVEVVELPSLPAWIRPGDLLLSASAGLRHESSSVAAVIETAAQQQVAGIAMRMDQSAPKLPNEVLVRADDLGVPVIALPRSVALHHLATDIADHALDPRGRARMRVLTRIQSLHHGLAEAVVAGAGLDALAVRLADDLQVLVVICTPAGLVLATGGENVLVRQLREGPCFEANGRVRVDDPILSPGLHTDYIGSRAVASVRSAGLDLGMVVVFAPGKGAIRDEELIAAQRCAQLVALVILRDGAESAVQDKFRTGTLRDLVTCHGNDLEGVLERARAHGWDLERETVVVVAAPDDLDPLGPVHQGDAATLVAEQGATLARVARARDHGAAVAWTHDECVVVLGVPPDDDVRRLADMVVASARSEPGRRPARVFSAGVSRVSSTPGDLPAAYRQAQTALTVGRQVNGLGVTTHFDDLGVYRLLSLVDTRELAVFAADTLRDLATADQAAADLRRTLQVLLDTNLNVAEAARRLHFHYNTMRYRIAKIERIVGPFTESEPLRLELSMALKVVGMQGLRAV